jgi:hypothetical protein
MTMNDASPAGGFKREIFVETWAADYGSPNQIDETSELNGSASLITEEGFLFVAPTGLYADVPLAFVDGVRRAEAPLAQWINETTIPGLAGAFAVGATIVEPGAVPIFAREQVERLVVWSGGQTGSLPAMPGGWSWRVEGTAEPGPAAPLRRLQELMRRA